MVNFFHRTSTYRVYEIMIHENTEDPKLIHQRMLELGHKRTIADVRSMVNLIKFFGLHEQKFKDIVSILASSNPNSTIGATVYLANEFVNEMMERGLLLRPFLEAVMAFPNNNRAIQYEFVRRAEKYGFYDQRIGDDISAAMRNFTSMLNLTVPNPKRGQYELTKLGQTIIGKCTLTYQRVICDQGEPCRKVCPSGAISAFRINPNCISCGLCVAACPYGAIEIDCSSFPQLKFHPEKCKTSSGRPKTPIACGIQPLLSEELVLQRWIKQILARIGITSEIPGIGEYPDLVIYDLPAFVEVKRNRITAKKVSSLVNQVLRYAQDKVITNTLNHLKLFSDLDWHKPDSFIIVAPKGGKEQDVVTNLRKELSNYRVYFISVNSLYNLSINSFKNEHIRTDEFFKLIR